MSENHDHPHIPVEPRQPSAQNKINMLNQLLDQKAMIIRQMELGDVDKTALLNDVIGENIALQAAMDQIRAENLTLRERLGIDPLGAIEPSDSDSVENNSLDT